MALQFMFNPGTGKARGGTREQAGRLMSSFLARLAFSPLHVESYSAASPDERPSVLDGYYDYRLAVGAEPGSPYVILMMPGVAEEKVICGDDYNPFTVCRLYVEGSSYFWPGAIEVCREKLNELKEGYPGENR